MKAIHTSMAVALSFFAGTAMAQSSKFAATYDTDPVLVEVSVDGGEAGCVIFNEGLETEYTECEAIAGPVSEAELASLHVANWKELLMGVSGEVNLVTITQAKGKNAAGSSTSIAEGAVRVGVLVLPEGARQGNLTGATCARAFNAHDNDADVFAAPGPVTFAARRQELAVTVDLDVVGAIPAVCDAACIEENLAIEGDVMVKLGLDTTAAHHFNFIADDLSSGWYEVLACYDLRALAKVSGAVIDADTSAYAKAALGPRILTVQEVRATKDGVIDESGSAN